MQEALAPNAEIFNTRAAEKWAENFVFPAACRIHHDTMFFEG